MEKETATHSSVLAWRIPGIGEPGGLPSMGSHRVGHDWSNLAVAAAERNEEAPVIEGCAGHLGHLSWQQFEKRIKWSRAWKSEDQLENYSSHPDKRPRSWMRIMTLRREKVEGKKNTEDLVSSVCMPGSGISGSYGSSISSFLRTDPKETRAPQCSSQHCL